MKYLYIASTFDEECIKRRFGGKPVLQYAASKYNTLLFEGLVENGVETDVLSVVPINRSCYKKAFFKGYKAKKDKLKISYLSQINLPVVKNLGNIFTGFFKTLFARKDTVVIYDVLVVSASMGALLAAKLRGFKKVGIVTDLPRFQGVRDNAFLLKMSNKVVDRADGYVFLTRQMNDEVNKTNKPYLVLEGHVDINMQHHEHYTFSDEKKNVMFAGSIENVYGIGMLCDAFLQVAKPNEILHMFGSGSYEKELSEIAEKNENILYYGNRPNEEIVEAELKATLLVNPRPTTGEFTKFSFPSKTLEYMVSGTPVLSARLAGIPEEYENYIFYFDENTAESLGSKIREILDLSSEELAERGASARRFALEEKNNVAQSAKIIEFSRKLREKKK